MKIKACYQTFQGTPVEIVEQLRELLLDKASAPDVESYIGHIKRTYKMFTDTDMLLPDGATDVRIREMFGYMEGLGILEVLPDA